MAQRVGRFGLHARRVGIRDPDPDLVGLRRRAFQVFEVAEMERLEAPVNHPPPHVTTTPAPSSTWPTRRRNRCFASNAASSAGALSLGKDTSRPPAVCGS